MAGCVQTVFEEACVYQRVQQTAIAEKSRSHGPGGFAQEDIPELRVCPRSSGSRRRDSKLASHGLVLLSIVLFAADDYR